MPKKARTPEERSADQGSVDVLQYACDLNCSTTFDRADDMLPCPIGEKGQCCKHCAMGPCRLTKDGQVGVCGATIDTVVARNFARMVAAGSSAHSDHGRGLALTLLEVAEGTATDYAIRDPEKLKEMAYYLDVPVEDRSLNEIAYDVAVKALAEFGKPRGELAYTRRAPAKRQKIWHDLKITPRNIDREVVEMMHRTHMGNDQDAVHILDQAMRTGLADGWGGSMLGTDISDVLFGTPGPVQSEVGLGVLSPDEVNIVLHGHEPTLSEMVVVAASDPELIEYAKSKGAKGIALSGLCCTANEIIMRQGIPTAGNFLEQELAIMTGAVESMVVDVQCIMQGDVALAAKFHTRCITTSPKARIRGATHIEFEEHHALDTAKKIVREAIAAFPKRDQARVKIPSEASPAIAGFSHEAIKYMLGGSFRASYRPLNENIINGRIRGVAGVVGCTQPKIAKGEQPYLELVKELVANDVLVVETGCAALECGRSGFLLPEFMEAAGPGLREVCETVGMPPVLHAGSCVDNSRILIACTEMVHEGGLGDDLSALPVAGACFEWMNEKAIAIGQYFVSSGAFVAFGITLPVYGSPNVVKYLTQDIEAETGGKWAFGLTPSGMAAAMIDHINAKRTALGIDKPGERVLYDMEARRQLKF